MLSKKDQIQQIRTRTGWAYYDMKWLSEKQVDRENRWRRKKIKWLTSRINCSFQNNKLHLGPLSPGCMTCGESNWSCVFLTHRCPSNCFFCQKNHALAEPPEPYTDSISFSSCDDYAKYIELFDYKGMSISGGDSLSNFEGSLRHIRAIKKRLGDKTYLWAYTSGLEVSSNKLKRLKEAGLDEIRFNIAANGYNTSPLKLATKWIPTVTVEIPVIPDDFSRLTTLLPKLYSIGVKHLNLHELHTTQPNHKALIQRGYTFLHTPTIDVLESGNVALEILEYAVRNKLTLPINYCSSSYKLRFQEAGRLHRSSPCIVRPYEEINKNGLIRSIAIVAPPKLDQLIDSLKARGINKKHWHLDKQEETLFIHSQLIDKIRIPRKARCIYIDYYSSDFSNECTQNSESEITISSKKRIFANRVLKVSSEPNCLAELICFKDLFIKKLPPDDAIVKYSGQKSCIKDVSAFRGRFKTLETLEDSADEIY